MLMGSKDDLSEILYKANPGNPGWLFSYPEIGIVGRRVAL